MNVARRSIPLPRTRLEWNDLSIYAIEEQKLIVGESGFVMST